jgi:hypothetical protein
MSSELVANDRAPYVDVSVNLNADDVAAVLMGRVEAQLKSKLLEHAELDKTLSAGITAATKDKRAAVQKAADEYVTESGILDAIAALKRLVKATDAPVNIDSALNDDAINVDVTVKGHGRRALALSLALELKKPAFVTKLEKAEKELAELYHKNRDEWMTVKVKLGDISSLERQARASIASHRLAQSDEGKELLSVLSDDLEDRIRLLGVR